MRTLRWAIAFSICLHLLILGSGYRLWPDWLSQDAQEPTVSVRLLPPPPEQPQPAKKKPAKATKVPPVLPAPSEPTSASGHVQAPAPEGPTEVLADAPEGRVQAGVPGLQLPRLRSGSIHFVVTKGEAGFIVGRAKHDWKVDGERYVLRSVIETSGVVALFADVRLGQTSSGIFDEQGLRPMLFRDTRKDGEFQSQFDWREGVLYMGNGMQAKLTPGAQDLLSMFYQFSLYPLDTPELSMMVTTGRKFERYVFKVEPGVPLVLNPSTDDYPIQTYHLSYRGREEEGVDVWLARDMDKLPVKIRYTDRKGGVTELTAQAVDYQGQKSE